MNNNFSVVKNTNLWGMVRTCYKSIIHIGVANSNFSVFLYFFFLFLNGEGDQDQTVILLVESKHEDFYVVQFGSIRSTPFQIWLM